MPVYEYKCGQCGRFEIEQSIKADALTACPTCGSSVERLISRNVNIIFKGSGFYINDSRKSPGASDSGSSNGSGGSNSAQASGSGGGDGGKSGGSEGKSSATQSAGSSDVTR